MNEKRSYKIEEFTADINREIDRLRAQVDLFWDKEKKYYEEFGLKNGTRVLECGSGPGFLIHKISEHYPDCTIHSLEIDPLLAAYQNKHISQLNNAANITVSEGSIYNNELPENHFDIIIARLVLEHLPEPVSALTSMHRLLNDDGKIIIVDNDFDYHLRTYPDIPELEDMYKAYCRLREDEGGNPRIGRQLPVLLQQAGFEDIRFSMFATHSSLASDRLFLESESAGISSVLLRKGYLADDVFDRLSVQWNRLLSTENHLYCRPLFIASGKKGEEVTGQNQTIKNQKAPEKTTQPRDLTDEIMQAVERERHGLIMKHIAQMIISTLELPETTIIKQNESLLSLGLDSIMGMTLKDDIDNRFNINISIARLLKTDTISEISKLILVQIINKSQPASEEFEEGEI